MNVLNYNFSKKISPGVLIIGAFDALHNGHLQLINYAKKLNLPISITLFDNVILIPSKKTSWQYSSLNVKLEQLSKLGIENVLLISFQKIQNLSGESFIKHLLKKFNPFTIIVGKNFAYGKNRGNNLQDLKKQFKNTIAIADFKQNNQKISTSFLKQLVRLGEVDLITQLAPFPYTREIKVSSNHEVIWNQPEKLAPGIYAVFVIVHQTRYSGVLYHHSQKSKLYCPDLVKNQILIGQILIISLIRLCSNFSEINYVKENFSDDLTNSKNKLNLYLKNRI